MADEAEETPGEPAPNGPGIMKTALASGAKASAAGAVAGAVAGGPPGAAVGAGIGFLGGTLGELAKAAVESFQGATERLEEAAEREKARALEDAVPEIVAQLARLRQVEESERDLVSNLRAVLHAWSRAWDRTGDTKKHRVLMAALVGALDSDSYRSGLTLRLFRVLEDLDYPELHFLRTAFNPGLVEHEQGAIARGSQEVREGTRTREHLERLKDLRLVAWQGAWSAAPNADAFVKYARRTWLGDQLLALCADREALNRVWPDPDAKPAQ